MAILTQERGVLAFRMDAQLDAFAREVNRPDEEIDLLRAALEMGRFAYPDLDTEAHIHRLTRLADAASRYLLESDDISPLALARFLFEVVGFAGNAEHYTDPRNSFLNEVLVRRLGIPISLSVVYLEVARRSNVAAEGVGLPGHFIVRVHDPNGQVMYLDPFHRGAVLTEADCRARVHALTAGRLPFHPAFLQPVGRRYILTRMLNNLKHSYLARGDVASAAQIVERLLVLSPDDLEVMRDLGVLYAQLGKVRAAISLLQRYVEERPTAPDVPAIQAMLRELVQRASRWN